MYANYVEVKKAIYGLEEFTGNSCRGVWIGEEYRVYSYRTLIASAMPKTGGMVLNVRKYSSTTSRLQNIIRNAWSQFIVTEVE